MRWTINSPYPELDLQSSECARQRHSESERTHYDRLDHDPQSGWTCLDHHRRQRVSYSPRRGFFGTETFLYTIIDRQGATDTAAVTVTVLPVFVNPIVVDDSFDVQENSTSNVLNVLANDFSGQAPPIAIVEVLQPSVGIAEIDDRGTTDPATMSFCIRPTPVLG